MTGRQAAIGIVLMLTLPVSSWTAASAEPPGVWFAYDHSYFVSSEDSESDQWSTEAAMLQARWNFWFMSDEEDVFPFRMDLESSIPIDEDLWHAPEYLSTSSSPGYYEYSWLIEKQPGAGTVDGPCFSLDVERRVDPGVSFRRVMTPAVVPPGQSTIRADVTITVDRPPTISGIEVDVGEVRAQVFAKATRGNLQVSDCRVSARSGAWKLMDPNDWPTYGVRMDLSGSQVGEEFSVSLQFTVTNSSCDDMLFKPVAEIGWEPQVPLHSEVRRSEERGVVSCQLWGPNGELLQVRATPQGRYPIVDWQIEPMVFHGAICAYWPLVVEEL